MREDERKEGHCNEIRLRTITKWNPTYGRPKGMPRSRWVAQVKKDIKELTVVLKAKIHKNNNLGAKEQLKFHMTYIGSYILVYSLSYLDSNSIV